MKIRFYNAKILTMQSEDIITGELHTDGDKITFAGSENIPQGSFDREIDLTGKLIIPGFKNAHTHTAMTFLRSFADDLPLNDWLYEQVFPHEAKLTEEAVYVFTQLGNMEYLTSGITSSFDMYMKLDSYAKACTDMGYRSVLCGSINDFGGTVEGIEEEYNKFNRFDPLISYQLGFHAEYTTKRGTLEGLAKLSQKYKAPMYMHSSETKSETDGCRERYGLSPTQFFEKLGMLEYGGGGFHCVWFDEEDMRIAKEKGLWIVTNPSSNLKLASGIAPLCCMILPLLSSTIVKFTGRSNISALSFNTERQNELIVLTTELLNLISCSRGIAFSPEFLEASSIARVILVRNSSAALRVNVITANLSALTGGISAASFPRISLTTRSTSRAVFPLPAAADTHAELSDG